MDTTTGLTLRELEVFVAVAERGSVAGAAKRLRGSPSAISQQLTNLEQCLGVKLLDRATRPLKLTPAGSQLLQYAEKIVDLVNSAKFDMMNIHLGSLPKFRIAIIDDLDATITPALVAGLSREHPSCQLIAWSGRSEEHRRSLLERESDVIITAETMDDVDDVAVWPLLREPIVLAAAKGALRGKPVSHLKTLPFVRYSSRMPLGREIERHLRRIKLNPPRRYEFDATHSVFAMVAQSGGWALTTPLCYLDAKDFHGRVEILPPPFVSFTRTIVLAARKGELGSLPAKLAERCRKLIARDCVPDAIAALKWLDGRVEVIHDALNAEVIPDSAPMVTFES